MAGSLLPILEPVNAIAVAIASLATGIHSKDPLWLLRRPGLLVRSLVTVLLFVPLVEVVLAHVLAPENRTVHAGLLVAILAVGIGPPELLRRTSAGGEAASFQIGLNLALMTVAAIYLPAAVALHAEIFRQEYALPWRSVGRIVLLQALLPFCAGLAIARWLPKLATPIERRAPHLVVAASTAPLLVALPIAAPTLIALGASTWLTCLLIAAAAIAVGHGAGGPRRETRIVLAQASALRFPPLALLLVSMLPPAGMALLPAIAAYVIGSVLLVALYRVAMALRGSPAVARSRASR